MKKNNFKKGLTLLEILVVTAIFGIIVAGLLALLVVADRTWNTDMGILDLQQATRASMDGMIKEIRQAEPSNVTINAGGSRVDFFIPFSAAQISYYLFNNQIIREHPAGVTKVLALNVNQLNFCCLYGIDCFDCSAGTLRIQIMTTKTVKGTPISFSLIERVGLRNE